MRPKLKIDNGKWFCYDNECKSSGNTPHEAWMNYHKQKEFDKELERMYNYVEVIG